MSKASVNYRAATGKQRCGNCVMFRPSQAESAITLCGRCTLVEGPIRAEDTCDRWAVRKDAAGYNDADPGRCRQ